MSESDPLSEFRADVRTWLNENFPPSLKNKSLGMEGGAEGLGPDLDVVARAPREEGLGRADMAEGIRRRRTGSCRSARDQRRDGPRRRVQSDPDAGRHGHHDGRTDRARVRHRRSEAPPSARHRERRGALVPRTVRAERRLRPGVADDESRRQRRPVRRQRTEDLDVGRRHFAVVRRARSHRPEAHEARRHQFPVAADGSAGRAHAADQADRRRIAVLRDVFRQRDRREDRSARQAERRLERREAPAAARAAESDRRTRRRRRRTSGEARRPREAICRHERRRHARRCRSAHRGSRAT